MNRTVQTFLLVFCTLIACVWRDANLQAQDSWADKMFAVRGHDFGTVARGTKTEFRFVFTNPYVETLHVARITSSCTCTSAFVEKAAVPTYESGEIVAVFDTFSKAGANAATITVVFDKPYYREVQLNVRGFIRGDVTFSPKSVYFGIIPEGQGGTRTVDINYAGNYSAWRVLNAESTRSDISARVLETRPNPMSQQVRVRLEVKLDPAAQLGAFSERIFLITNDGLQQSRLPLLVEGTVHGEMGVNPPVLFFGTLHPGETSIKNVVISGNAPFVLTGLTSNDPTLFFDLPKLSPQDARAIWVVAVKTKIPQNAAPENRRATISVQTGSEKISTSFETLTVVSD